MSLDTAVVLAAGEGRRLRPLTKHRPKPMLPAANRPILEHVLDALVEAGIDDIHLVVGYERDRVQDHFGPTYRDRPISYHLQRNQLGSGHALQQVEGDLDTDFLVVNGDQLVQSRLVSDVLGAHTPATDTATLAIVQSERTSDYGGVEIEGDQVVRLVEKPRPGEFHYLNAGVYAFAPSIFETLDSTPQRAGELSLIDAIVRLLDSDRQVRGVRTEGVWLDATYPWDLLSVAQTVLSRAYLDADGTAYLGRLDGDEPVRVDTTAAVHEDATLRGPVVVGPDTVVGPRAVVGPNVALGANVTVESGSVVKRSVVDGDTLIGANATVVDCVTGQGVQLGPGTTIPGGEADVRVNGEVHERCQLGGVVADRARIGGGSTIAPGVLVGPGALLQPGTHVDRNVDEAAEVRN